MHSPIPAKCITTRKRNPYSRIQNCAGKVLALKGASFFALWVKVLSYRAGRVEKSVVSSFRGDFYELLGVLSFVRDWANKNGWYFPCDSRGPQKVFQEPRQEADY